LGDAQSAQVAQAFIDTLRSRIDEVKEKDNKWEKVVKKERRRRTMRVDSDLSNFIID
jgi:flagellar biosynthesis chaperone FliJ